jgi:hypothetical protein
MNEKIAITHEYSSIYSDKCPSLKMHGMDCECLMNQNWTEIHKKSAEEKSHRNAYEQELNQKNIESGINNTVCRGFAEPIHRMEKHVSKNPDYLLDKDPRIDKNSEKWKLYSDFQDVNFIDEFICHERYIEMGTVCMDCKKSDCGVTYEEPKKRY